MTDTGLNPHTGSEPRAKTFTWADPHTALRNLRDLSGLQYLQGLRDGTIPPPPMATLINAAVTEVEEGRVQFHCTPGEEHLNPLGTVHGGLACTLLDTVTGCAAHTVLAPGIGYTSLEIKVSYLRPLTLNTGPVIATGTVTKAGSRVIFADAALTDTAGRPLATASSSLLILDTRG
ncbi:PaaI family thioesterase [Streptomyces parvulus]|uniref:PaaI family thioesterase n=1 Tax=Streptomyces parvulus TaxID=146923 RepID=UPI001CFB4D17|nr:PaaI family thioesterase [Streptomyces parvulus]MCC9157909.1 PaaI family thioesterase [Streptomyces parvulus]MCE7690217.1 PaaI family thioesterase [Streptomyces parvulus]